MTRQRQSTPALGKSNFFRSFVYDFKRTIPSVFILLLLLLDTKSTHAEIVLIAESSIRIPEISITGAAHSIQSEEQKLCLKNSSVETGWNLLAEVYQYRVEGQELGGSLSATLKFKSIRSIDQNAAKPHGMRISENQSRIEADPGSGIGTFEIIYEIELTIPPFPYADRYYGISTFSIQI